MECVVLSHFSLFLTLYSEIVIGSLEVAKIVEFHVPFTQQEHLKAL